MIFIFLSVGVPIVVWLALPTVVWIITGKRLERNALLLFACLIYFVSWYLPSPLIHGVNTAFTTHLLGGGVFSGCLWLFIKKGLPWKSTWFIELMSLYAFVSALGVANELFELALVELQLARLSGRDTWWDLLANTLGALLFWLTYCVAMKLRKV